MDSLTRGEFHAIFGRVSMHLDLRGCTSAVRIDNALKIARHESKMKFKESKRELGRKWYGQKAEQYDKLLEHDFGGRTVYEALRNSRGFVSLTLKYGRKEARERILAQKRAQIRGKVEYGFR